MSDLEVLSIWSDHIDKTSEEAADKEQIADEAAEMAVYPLVAAMLAVGTAEAAKTEKEKAAAIAAEEVAAAAANKAEDQRWQKGQRIKTKGLTEMKAAKKDNRKVVETVEEKSERLKEGLESCLW